ncbi:MAG: hypothetical protein V4726_18165 [Verrucomicrobiota bacterium]
MKVAQTGFLNLAAAQDTITISFWQKLTSVTASRTFFTPFVPADPAADKRVLSSRAPCSNNNFYWDTAGCRNTSTQRILVAKPAALNPVQQGWRARIPGADC